MNKTILVTGGAGFIGSNLTLALQEAYPDYWIVVLDDFRSGAFKNLEGFRGDAVGMDISRADLGKYLDAKKVAMAFHLASITDTTNHNQPQQVHDNVEGWRNLLSFFAGSKAKLVYASSAATYGISSGINRVNDPAQPANVYAFSKVILDNLARRWASENPTQTVVGLRYFNVYGPRETHKGIPASMIYHLAQQMKQGQRPRIFKYGEQKRDFVYVKDVCALTMAAASAKQSGIYNSGSGTPRSFNDLIECLNKALGADLKPEYIDNPHTHYQPHTEADMAATIEALEYRPKFSLEEGIADYLQSGWL